MRHLNSQFVTHQYLVYICCETAEFLNDSTMGGIALCKVHGTEVA